MFSSEKALPLPADSLHRSGSQQRARGQGRREILIQDTRETLAQLLHGLKKVWAKSPRSAACSVPCSASSPVWGMGAPGLPPGRALPEPSRGSPKGRVADVPGRAHSAQGRHCPTSSKATACAMAPATPLLPSGETAGCPRLQAQRSPLRCANTRFSSPRSPSLLVSALLPGQREQSLTALQDLPERDQSNTLEVPGQV